MKTNRRTRYLATLAVVGATAGALITATPASAAHATGTAARSCGFDTLMHNAAVREKPDTDSKIRKRKKAGDIITFPCADPVLVLDIESGVSFIHAECSCARDGIGWIR